MKLIFTINTTYKKYKAYLYYHHHCAHVRNVYNAHKPYTKGIYIKLCVSHQYVRQIGPTYVKSHEQNVPYKLSHALTKEQ